MVFRRRRQFKRRRFNGKRTGRRLFRRGTRGAIKRVYRKVRRLEKGVETKVLELIVSTTINQVRHSITSTSFLTRVLNVATQGTDYSQRVGKRITNKTLELQFRVQCKSSIINSDKIFAWLGWCREWDNADETTFDPQNATLGSEGIWLDSSTTAGPAAMMLTRRWFSRKEYHTIKYKTYEISLAANGGWANLGWAIDRKWHVKLGSKQTLYSANTGTSTDLKNNALVFILGFSRDDNTVGNPPLATFVSRLKFTDQ